MKVLLAALLIGASAGDKGPSQEGYGGSNQEFYTPQVKYAGPIVYSGEKPPIIHFPPPPKVEYLLVIIIITIIILIIIAALVLQWRIWR